MTQDKNVFVQEKWKEQEMREPIDEKPKPGSFDVQLEVNRHLLALRTLIKRSNRKHRQIAAASGISASLLSATLMGCRRLTVGDELAIIKAVGLTPREYYMELATTWPQGSGAD